MPSPAITIYPHRPGITVPIGLDRDLQAVLGEDFGQARAPLHHGDRAGRVGVQVQVVHLAEDRLEISIEPDPDGDTRTVRLHGHGARWHGVLTGAVDRL